MTTSQTNTTSPLVPAWAMKTWHIYQVDTQKNSGVSAPDIVTFPEMTAGTMVQILRGLPQNLTRQTMSSQGTSWLWGTLEPGSVAASISSSASPIEVAGQTMSGQPFHLEYPYTDPDTGEQGKLACYLDEPPPQLSRNAVALGAIAGTLLGAVVGFFFRSPGVGATVGAVASTGGLLVAHIITNYGTASSTPTWVANDGPAGRPGQPESGPHYPLKVVGA